MDRLTTRNKDGSITLKDATMIAKAFCRLAEYEDTGLTPEEIHGLCEMDKRSRMAKMLRWEQAEAEGRLNVMPCKVGDTLYAVSEGRVTEKTVEVTNGDGRNIRILAAFACDDNCDGCIFEMYSQTYEGEWFCGSAYGVSELTGDDIGKTVFRTREEAEKALEENK